MRPTRGLGVLACVACAVTLVAAGCGGSAGSGKAAPASGGTFTMAISADPGNLDPLMTVLSVTRRVDYFAYDTLVHLAPDGTIKPWLAASWRVDPARVTFTLTKGVTCSDGSPLTASDVAATLNFVSDPKNKSPLLGVLIPAGLKASADDAAGTVTVTAPHPDSFLLREAGTLFVVCEKGMRDRSTLRRGTEGTGMFKLTEAVAGDHYTFVKRPEYAWGPGGITAKEKGTPDKVVLRVVPNETTAANLMLSGQLNAVALVGPDRARLASQHLSTQNVRAVLGEMFFNEGPGHPGRDEAVRRALTAGLQLDQLGRAMTNGTGVRSQGLITATPKPCAGDTVRGHLPRYDPGRAAALLDQAGWAKGPGGIRAKDGKKLALTFVYGTSLGDQVAAAAELLAEQWRRLGAQVDLKGVTPTQINTILFSSGDWDAGWVPITVNLPTQLVPFLSGPTPPEGTNFAHIGNPDYTRLTTEAARLAGDAACAKWNAAETALFTRVDVVPIVDTIQPLFGKGARFQVSGGELIPPTIRLLDD